MADLVPDSTALLPRKAATTPVAEHAVHCRNCGAPAPADFCPRCGQETAIALPTARQFLKEAAGRYVALDGRLWRTLGALLFRPGFLTREYLAGRRRRYIRPARLFLVLSIAMFALFRIVVDVPSLDDSDAIRIDDKDASAALQPPASGDRTSRGMSIAFDDKGNLLFDGPPGPVTDALKARVVRFNALPRQEKIEQIAYGAMRYGPYAMVVLLPAFALILKLLYLGRTRRHPSRPRRYAEHLVFAAHDLSFLFLIVMFAVLAPWAWIETLLWLWVVGYGLWAMKAVYGGSWLGVVVRGSCLAISYFALFGIVTVGLLVTAILLR